LMNRRSKAVTRETHYQPSWTAALLALTAAMLLTWHGMAKADPAAPQFAPIQIQPDKAPLAPNESARHSACTDTMDMAPEDAQGSAFDADKVAFRDLDMTPRLFKVEAYDTCKNESRVSSV
jgi:hypothetical protein